MIWLAACRSAGPREPVHLIDQAATRAGTAAVTEAGVTIDAVWKRIVAANPVRFPLERVPVRPRLRFTFGLQAPAEGRVRFQIFLERPNALPTSLYSREVSTPGWIDEEIDLGAHELAGGQLQLQKTLTDGPGTLLGRAHFAEPILVPGAPRSAPSVILVSIDTLRADRVGAYSRPHARTPTLDKLAAEGVSYATTYSPSTWTYPSHASLLHGLYPASLPQVGGSAPATPVMPPPTLGELFRQGGYLTAGFTGGGFMSDIWGFQRGFDTFYAFVQSGEHGGERCPADRFDGPSIFTQATRWLRDNARHPFFLFIHTYEAHDRCEVAPVGVPPLAPWPDPGPSGRQRMDAYYDDRIGAADALVARLVDALRELGLTNEVVLAVTSDHGEALWEHGFAGHGCPNAPFDELVRVPLIIRAAGQSIQAGSRIDQPVSGVDVAPTLLALAGLTPPASLQGFILPGLGLEGRAPTTPIFVHCGDNLAVRVGHHKLITSRKTGAEAVYDLERDPGERTPVAVDSDAVGELLRRYASEYWSKGSAAAGASEDKLEGLDESARERLRALGYVE